MEQNPKQQVVERVRQATNVLVTVSTNPSVDALGAAIGLTLMLNKLGKHATAVFSGKVPPAIQFLEPEKTLDDDVEGLRDFIISLDKDKADKLRYKVEDNVVKIFITPYKTKISEKDLRFEQGDFNVDVVIALGVGKRDDLDNAIKAHGRILHDATVVTINAGSNISTNLGAIDWSEPTASSLSEMLVSISEAFQGGLLDAQIANAFLTGIVAATERFSNKQTSPKVMTMAAQLMAAGANQQLIVTSLTKPTEQKTTPQPQELRVDHAGEQAGKPPEEKPEDKEEPPAPPPPEPPQDLPPVPPASPTPPEPLIPTTPPVAMQPPTPTSINEAPPLPPAERDLQNVSDGLPPIINETKAVSARDEAPKPLLGGTFNATSEEAHKAAEAAKRTDINNTVLSHEPRSYMSAPPSSMSEQPQPSAPPPPPPVQPLPPQLQPQPMQPADPLAMPPPVVIQPQPQATQPMQESQTIDIESARKEVEEAAASAPYNPANNPMASLGSVPLPQVDQPGPAPSTFAPPPPAGPVMPAQEPGQPQIGETYQLPPAASGPPVPPPPPPLGPNSQPPNIPPPPPPGAPPIG